MLFEKALESFNILQQYSNMDDGNSLYTMEFEIQRFEGVMDDEALIHIEDESKDGTENAINYCDTISVNECKTVEPRHFLDIQNFESSDETTLEKQLNDISDVNPKLRAGRKTDGRKKGRALESILDESCNAKLSRSSASERISRKRSDSDSSPDDTLLELELNDCCDAELSKSSAARNAANEINNNKSKHETLLEERNPDESEDENSIIPATKPKKLRKKPFMCAYCSLTMDTASKLEIHEATHNENRKRTETCPQCGVKLFTKLSLNEHMKTHDEKRQKKHKCEFCGKAFYNRGALNVHRRIHLGLMVKCHICPKEYFRQIDLDKHLLTHSETPLQKNLGGKKYAVQCQYCNKSVVTVKWKAHLAAHLDQPQVKCKICEKNFFSRKNCSNHLRRFHHKNASEYEDFIHYYDQKTRVNILVMKQQLSAQPLIGNQVK